MTEWLSLAHLLPDPLWMRISLVPAALVVDAVTGDPRWLPHPVVMMGKAISLLEKWCNRSCYSCSVRRTLGAVTAISVILASYLVPGLLLGVAYRFGSWVHFAVSVWIMSTCLAMRGLADAGLGIARLLDKGDLAEARVRVGWIVGRDTDAMDEAQVCRAAVETVAENSSDGVIAPLLYGILGGPALAMAYKAVNTLDSMVGYKSERFRCFGWAGARMDDLWNLVPARLTMLCILASAALSGRGWAEAWNAVVSSAHEHPSPNSRYPEAAVAGALGVELGGLNHYGGVPQMRARMGSPRKPLDIGTLKASVGLMAGAAIIFTAVTAGIITVLEVFI